MFHIWEPFTWQSCNLIYIIMYKRCHKEYIGKTDRKLAECFCKHIMDIHKEAAKTVSLYLNSSGHQVDISVTALKSCSGVQITHWSSGLELLLPGTDQSFLPFSTHEKIKNFLTYKDEKKCFPTSKMEKQMMCWTGWTTSHIFYSFIAFCACVLKKREGQL